MAPTPTARRARRPATPLSLAACALGVAAACGEPTGTGPGSGGTADALEYDLAWIGRFTGSGQGLAADSILHVPEAVLTIMRDDDSVRVAACPRCMTVVLDTVFMRVNVAPADPQRIEIVYELDGVRRSLTLERYSGGGSVSNVVLANLRMRAIGGGLIAQVTYVLDSK